MKKMIYGTTNPNKVKDIKAIIAAHKANIEVLSLKDIGFQEETSGVVAEQAELRSGGNHVFAIPVFKIFIEVFQPGIVAIGEKPRIEICVDFVEVIAATIQISNPFGITE